MTTTPTSQATGAGLPTEAEVHHSRRWWALAVLSTAQLMVILDTTIVNIALPTAQRDLGFSNADRQWVVTAYALAFGSLLLLGGRIGDMIGRRRTLIIGLVGFAAASALGGASVNFAMLVTARTVQGAFGALLAPSVLAMLTTTFTDPAERGKAFGIYSAVAIAGGAMGLLLGGVLTSYVSWRWTLFVNVAIAVLAIIGSFVYLKDDRATDHDPLDIPGLLLVSGGLFSIVYGFAHAETTSWSDRYTIGFLVLAPVLLSLFVWTQSRVRFPILPLRVVVSRTRGGSLLALMFANVGIFGVFLFLTYYLQESLGFSAIKTGLAFLPMSTMLVIASLFSNRTLLPRVGPKPMVPVGMAICAVAAYMLHLVGLHSTYTTDVLPYVILLGLGLGFGLSPTFSTATLRLPSHDAGVGSAAVNTCQQVGASVGPALLNTLAASAAAAFLVGREATKETQALSAVHSYTSTFLWTALIFVIGGVVSGLVLPKGNLSQLAGEPAEAAVPL